MPSIRKTLKHAPRYFERFGYWHGLRIGLQTIGPKVLPANRLVSIGMPDVRSPVFLRARTSDVMAFHQIFVDTELECPTPGAPRFIVDGGSNAGYSAIYFANRYPAARIVTIEVDDANCDLMTRNVAPYSNITPMKAGLWSHSGFLRIENPDDAKWAHRVVPAQADDADAIPAVSIPDVMSKAGVDHIDILKLDIEGAERELFSDGGEAWIDRVGMIMVELHDHFRPGCTAAMHRLIDGRGFSVDQRGEYFILTKQPASSADRR